ncbi:hypothetical protein IE53DRAFT_217254 [Violaceomyces palustris]|uniref:Uncharacterized protein n=1 Tax=Violaceomyces palustris TaxID=1673888 RepID=A0ACD0P4P5_9BASI|nr:hypothetical protein IE53DRAFT_217254 [Violaceomyces palustris]
MAACVVSSAKRSESRIKTNMFPSVSLLRSPLIFTDRGDELTLNVDVVRPLSRRLPENAEGRKGRSEKEQKRGNPRLVSKMKEPSTFCRTLLASDYVSINPLPTGESSRSSKPWIFITTSRLIATPSSATETLPTHFPFSPFPDRGFFIPFHFHPSAINYLFTPKMHSTRIL